MYSWQITSECECECLLRILNGHLLLNFWAFFVWKKRLKTYREEDAKRWQRSCARSKWKVKAKWAINDAYRQSIVVVIAWGKRKRDCRSIGGRETSGNTCPSFCAQLCWFCSLHIHTHTHTHLNRNTLICKYLHNFIGHFVRFLSTLIST